jgi:hypothetical protein
MHFERAEVFSSASDDEVGGFSMFAPPICRRDGRTTLYRSARSDEDGGNGANITASRASNRYSAIARAAPITAEDAGDQVNEARLCCESDFPT